MNYRQAYNISRTKSQHLKDSCTVLWLFCRIPWGQMLSREWNGGSSADRRCSNYIWVIDNFIAYLCAPCIRTFTVLSHWCVVTCVCQSTSSLLVQIIKQCHLLPSRYSLTSFSWLRIYKIYVLCKMSAILYGHQMSLNKYHLKIIYFQEPIHKRYT